MKKLSFLVKQADHEFKSTVVQDEATGGWTVTKEVQETGSFSDEQSAIEWSTQAIGTPSPDQKMQVQPEPFTPIKQPIGTGEQAPQSSSPEQPEQKQQAPEENSENSVVDEMNAEESPFVEDGFTSNSSNVKGKVLASLQNLISSARASGHFRLAENLSTLKTQELLSKDEPVNTPKRILASLKEIERAPKLLDSDEVELYCLNNNVSVSEMSRVAKANGYKIVSFDL